MNLSDMKISTRLTAGFAAMAALIALLGGLSIYETNSIHSEFATVMEDSYPKIVMAQDIRTVNSEVSLAIRDLFVLSDPAALKQRHEIINTISKRTAGNLEKLKETIHSEVGKAALAKLVQVRADYRQPRDRVLELLRAGDLDGARSALNDLLPRQAAYMTAVDELMAVQERVMADSAHRVDEAVASSKLIIGSVIVAAIALACVLAVWIIRSISRPLSEAVRITRAVAEGDLAMEFKATAGARRACCSARCTT